LVNYYFLRKKLKHHVAKPFLAYLKHLIGNGRIAHYQRRSTPVTKASFYVVLASSDVNHENAGPERDEENNCILSA
jgi:hypothetical protein